MLDLQAERIIKRYARDYSTARFTEMKENPVTTNAYNSGVLVVNEKVYAQLAEHEKQNILLQNSPDYVRDLANVVIEEHANAIAGSSTGRLGPIGQATPERK